MCKEARHPRGPTNSPIGEDRRSGWVRTMHANGLSTTGLASRVEDVVHSGAEAAAVLLDESAPTAFVCASDTLAMGVMHTLWIRQLALLQHRLQSIDDLHDIFRFGARRVFV